MDYAISRVWLEQEERCEQCLIPSQSARIEARNGGYAAIGRNDYSVGHPHEAVLLDQSSRHVEYVYSFRSGTGRRDSDRPDIRKTSVSGWSQGFGDLDRGREH